MITTGGVGWSCILNSSRLSTEDDVILVFEGEYRSTLKSSPVSLATEVDRVEGPSVNETFDLRLSPSVLTTVTVIPPFLLFPK
jgi:hypothetical protein